jgi:hypothetical protein
MSGGLAYDSVRGRTILFGGDDAGVYAPPHRIGDLWSFDGATWSQLTPPGAPTPRAGTGMVFEPANDRVLVTCGRIGAFQDSVGTWELRPAGAASIARYGAGCAVGALSPSLDAPPGALPQLGTTLALQLTSLPATPGAAWLAFGFDFQHWNGLQLPRALGTIGLPACNLWVAPVASLLLLHPGSAVGTTLAIPANPAFAGITLGAQALVLDPAAASGFVAVTNGVVLHTY